MRPPAPAPWKETLLFGLVLAVNLPVKAWGITDYPLALDEPFSVYHAQFSIRHIWTELSQGNNPPLYEFFLHGWIRLFGTDVFWVRLPSVIFSSLAAGFWFLSVVRYVPLWVSSGVAFLFTFCTQYIYFSHEVRAYALLLLLLGVSAFFLFRILWEREKPSFPFALGGTFFLALAVYAHYLALIPVAFLLGYALLFRGPRNFRYKAGLALGTVLWLLPLAGVLIARASHIRTGGLWGSAPQWTQLYGFLNIFLNGRITFAVLAVLLVTGAVLYLWKRDPQQTFWTDGKKRAAYAGAVFASAYAAMYLLSYKYPVFIERYVQVTVPYFFVFLGFAATCLAERFAVAKWGWVSVLAIFGWQTRLSPDNERNPPLAAEMARNFLQTPDRAVLVTPFGYGPNFTYYFDRSLFSATDLPQNLGTRSVFLLWHGSEVAPWTAAHRQTRELLLVDAGESFLNGSATVLDALSADYTVTRTDSVDKATRVYYLTRMVP